MLDGTNVSLTVASALLCKSSSQSECCCDAAAGCMNDVTETIFATVNHVSSGLSGVGAVFLDLFVDVLLSGVGAVFLDLFVDVLLSGVGAVFLDLFVEVLSRQPAE
jgi:hypothetical protein